MRSLLTLTAVTLYAGAAQAAPLEIVVNGLGTKGVVRLAVVNSSEGWDGKAEPSVAIQAQVVSATMRFKVDVAPGPVAVRLYHDANSNGKLDSNMLGIPKEGYGFSNNPKVMGPAAFKDAVFTVAAAGTVTVIKVH
ncbi:MAG: DUF2141 domain-containing protein [Myxococcota bacterium]